MKHTFTMAVALLATASGCGTESASTAAQQPASTSSMFSGLSAGHDAGDLIPAAPSGPTVTLATYNVNYGVAGDPDTRKTIAELDADVVFLQETNEAWGARARLASGKCIRIARSDTAATPEASRSSPRYRFHRKNTCIQKELGSPPGGSLSTPRWVSCK